MVTDPAERIVIVGGGVMGLSLAYELSGRGAAVCVVDRQAPTVSASWAGAGILPPATSQLAEHPLDQLRALSYDLHATWAQALLEETGIDTEYARCGGIYIARTTGEQVSLMGTQMQWAEEGITAETLDAETLCKNFPGLRQLGESSAVKRAVWVPAEAQIRNPRHLQALRAACSQRGVKWRSAEVLDLLPRTAGRLEALETSEGRISGTQFCFTTGAWTAQLLRRSGVSVSLLPMRGQMLLFRLHAAPFPCIVNEGSRYVVPRRDGHVLVGSTEEEVGFDASTTEAAREELLALATACSPELNRDTLVRQWAGLRPATFDSFPYIGSLPLWKNAFVAAGHFRSGLFLSPGTAVLLADLVQADTPSIDPAPFRIGRG